MKIHTACSTIPVFSFFKILETGDYRYLIRGYFEDDDEVVGELLDNDYLVIVFNRISKEYSSLVATDKSIRNLKLELDIIYSMGRYSAATRVLQLYAKYRDVEILLLLKELHFYVDTSNAISPQVQKIVNLLKGLQNQINIKKIRYKKYNNIKDEEKEPEFEFLSLDKKCLYLEQNLNLSYTIDTKNTTLERYANLLTLNEERLKSVG